MSERHEHDHKQEPVKKTGCSSCEHCHGESPLPQGTLVATSWILTGIGLLLHWFYPNPAWIATLLTLFILPTLYKVFERKSAMVGAIDFP